MISKVTFHISTLYIYQISSIQALYTSQNPYIQETTKLIDDFILHTRNFLHTNGKNILCNGEYQ